MPQIRSGLRVHGSFSFLSCSLATEIKRRLSGSRRTRRAAFAGKSGGEICYCERVKLAQVRMLLGALALLLFAAAAPAQDRTDEEIVANLAGGRVIIHVARDEIIFAAIDQPAEEHGPPPRVMDIDGAHVGILFGAFEWQRPADPNPIRLDRNFQRLGAKDPNYAPYSEAEPDLETLGTAFLEKLRPLVDQLHHKISFPSDQPIFEVVVIGYGPNDYGPEVWTVEYRIEQAEIATRGDFWQTRILRPRFEQIYPPEKHAPHTIVEARYPAELKGPAVNDLIQNNDPRIERLASGDQRYAKVLADLRKGEAQKAPPQESADFMRALVPIITGDAPFVMGIMDEHGFKWVVAPEEPVEKAKDDKNRPPDAPTLRRKPNPNP
jgi:hypothetical protein